MRDRANVSHRWQWIAFPSAAFPGIVTTYAHMPGSPIFDRFRMDFIMSTTSVDNPVNQSPGGRGLVASVRGLTYLLNI